MEFLDFSAISCGSNFDIGFVCTKLNTVVGAGMRFETFTVQNTKWFWLLKCIVAAMNSDRVLCGAFGLYPGYVAGILKHVAEVHFDVLTSKLVVYKQSVSLIYAGVGV